MSQENVHLKVLTTEDNPKKRRELYRRKNKMRKMQNRQKQSGHGAETPENSFSDELSPSENTISG